MRAAWLRIGLALSIFLVSGGCRYYRLEFTKQKLGVADVIIVPGFELTDEGLAWPILHNRMAMARVLYAGGYGKRIIVSGGKPKRGITEAAKMVELARRMGIPSDALLVESTATSSVDNAELSAELMRRHGFASAVVVSDPGHLSYCVPVFRDAFFARGLVLYWTPVDYRLLKRLGIAKPQNAAAD